MSDRDVVTREITEMLPVPLDEDGFRARGKELTKLDEETREIREELKELKKKAAAKIGVLRERGHELITEMKQAAAMELVRVKVTWDYSAGEVIKNRMDTGEVIDRRAMTAEERQPELLPETVEG